MIDHAISFHIVPTSCLAAVRCCEDTVIHLKQKVKRCIETFVVAAGFWRISSQHCAPRSSQSRWRPPMSQGWAHVGPTWAGICRVRQVGHNMSQQSQTSERTLWRGIRIIQVGLLWHSRLPLHWWQLLCTKVLAHAVQLPVTSKCVPSWWLVFACDANDSGSALWHSQVDKEACSRWWREHHPQYSGMSDKDSWTFLDGATGSMLKMAHRNTTADSTSLVVLHSLAPHVRATQSYRQSFWCQGKVQLLMSTSSSKLPWRLEIRLFAAADLF